MTLYRLEDRAPVLPGADDYWVAPTASVIGDVRLGGGVGIWFGAVLRGDQEPIIIGENTNVQEHAVFHTDSGFPLNVGQGCTIGHRAILHGCTVGDNCLVGMGANDTEWREDRRKFADRCGSAGAGGARGAARVAGGRHARQGETRSERRRNRRDSPICRSLCGELAAFLRWSFADLNSLSARSPVTSDPNAL